MSQPIPQPPTIPFLGNITTIESEVPRRSFELLAKQYGEIYQLDLMGRHIVVVNSQELAVEACDEKRFQKQPGGPLNEVRNLVKDGLFTARPDEPNWAIAHRILMPAFGPLTVRNMFDDMQDIVSQMVMKWERFGAKHPINPVEDFTRLAFDAISLCAMNYRMNSFYQDKLPPFIAAMGDFLVESGLRARRPGIVQTVMMGTNAKYEADMKIMHDLTDEVLEDRKKNPIEKQDLLNMLLNGRDPVTGQGLPEDNIKRQLLTFFIAGHETTSGMLSFTMYHLLKNPHVYQKLQREVDDVLKGEQPRLEHMGKLPYVTAVMRESLRLTAPLTSPSVTALEDTVIGGRYTIKKGTVVQMSVIDIHHDTKVWGDDVDEFKPERMLDGNFEKLPPKAWMPFGNGVRGCIGRPFAWQEVTLTLATIFQRFDFHFVDPGYALHLKQTLTVKPEGLQFYATRRAGAPSLKVQSSAVASLRGVADHNAEATEKHAGSNGQTLYVLYGSNTGSCEAFAQRIASEAPSKGFNVKFGTLDSVPTFRPIDGPIVIVTASFEGEPAENAAHFVEALKAREEGSLKGVKYAVFGCGNREWVNTYQRIPKLIDELGTRFGGTRLLERGESDASGSTFFESFDEWETKLWAVLAKEYAVTAPADVSVGFDVKMLGSGAERASHLRQSDVSLGTVVENRLLTKEGAPVKRHIEFKLPEDATYRAGDYLAILPTNPSTVVQKAMARFGISHEQEISISSRAPTSIPTDRPIKVVDILSGYVELSQPATKKNIETLIGIASPGETRKNLESLLANYQSSVQQQRLSVLDMIVIHRDLDLRFNEFLSMLPSMRVRQYSISSSPLWNAGHVTLTVRVLAAQSKADSGNTFLGVASNFLASLQPGDKVQMAVRASGVAFHPPIEPTVPMIMFANGSGIAPFRGFLQERAMQKTSGREVGMSLLFFGCRHPDEDFLYGNAELADWAKKGVVEVRPAFSRASHQSDGSKYVQDRVWHDRADVVALFKDGAKMFTCGSGHAASGVKDACVRIIMEGKQVDEEEAQNVWKEIQRERYATDIFD